MHPSRLIHLALLAAFTATASAAAQDIDERLAPSRYTLHVEIDDRTTLARYESSSAPRQ